MNHTEVSITHVRLVPAPDEDRQRGLLGFLSFTYGALILDGVVVRRTAGGRLTLSFPSRRDRLGKLHSIVCPRDEQARLHIERSIFRQINLFAMPEQEPR